jgi:hypothetical protein
MLVNDVCAIVPPLAAPVWACWAFVKLPMVGVVSVLFVSV